MRKVSNLLVVAALCCVAAAQGNDLEEKTGLRFLEEGRTTLDANALNGARDSFLKLTSTSPANPVYWYELAQVDLYRCNAADSRGDKKAAMKAIDSAIDEVQTAIQLNDASAEEHSLLADLYGRRIGLGGFMVGAHFGPKVVAENKRVLELEGNNPRVFASLGRQYLEAPKMFGGDVDKAIANFQKSIALDPKSDETYVWLAIAERKKGDRGAADKALDEALQLNPRSAFAKKQLSLAPGQ